MKIYVAGVNLTQALENLTSIEICASLIASFPTIRKDAYKKMGNTDVMILVVLQEHALTINAVPNSIKKECLNLLQDAIKSYEDFVLIPGSFAAYQSFSARPDKVEKIRLNYELLNQSEHIKNDSLYEDEFNHFITQTPPFYLENSAYILTNHTKIKHKKIFPWEERAKMNENEENSVFYPGTNTPLQKITVHDKSFDFGILICREHDCEDVTQKLKESPPHIQIIVSASIKLQEFNLYGALNIQMDRLKGLTIYRNRLHSKSSAITEVEAAFYMDSNFHIMRQKSMLVTIKDINLKHALSIAAASGSFENIRQHLLTNSFQPHANENYPLLFAAENNQPELLKSLLQFPKVDPTYYGHYIPMIIAAVNSHINIVKIFLEDPRIKREDVFKKTNIQYRKKAMEHAFALIDSSIDIDCLKESWSALRFFSLGHKDKLSPVSLVPSSTVSKITKMVYDLPENNSIF